MSALGGGNAARERRWQLAAAALCVVGALARLAAYAQHRSLWYDEAALAVNVVQRGFIALLGPLDFLQTAPPLFLWAERLAILPLGASEWSLRAVPLVAGILTPPLMWRVARRVLPPLAAIAAVALVALSPTLVRYAAEAKPYAVDALITLIVVDRALAVAQPKAGRNQWWRLSVVGVIAIVSSTPAIFVLVGVVAFLALRATLERDGRLVRNTAAIASVWGGTFAVLLATVFRPLIGNGSRIGRFMHWYWAANFLTPDPPGLATKVSAILWAALTSTFVGETAFPNATTLLLGIAAVGVIALVVMRRLDLAVLLLAPFVEAAFVSALRLYPLAERLMLFGAPLTALLLASSFTLVYHRRASPRLLWIGAGVVAAGIVASSRGVLERLASNEGRQESRALVRVAAEQHATGLPVWVSGGGEPAWRFYAGVRVGSQRAGPDVFAQQSDASIAPDVLVGSWYNSLPERIRRIVDDTAVWSKPSPWSEREAGRIARLARPCALLFFSAMQPGEATALLASVAALGGTATDARHDVGASLYRVCFAARTSSGEPRTGNWEQRHDSPVPVPSFALYQLTRRSPSQVLVRIACSDRLELVPRSLVPALRQNTHEPITYGPIGHRVIERYEIGRRRPGLGQRPHRPLTEPRALLRIAHHALEPRSRLGAAGVRDRPDDPLLQALVIDLRVHRA